MVDPAPVPGPGSGERLDSWKDIASYLKRDVRTVRRWEAEQGLPVRRHLHNRKASVYAYRTELDTWWASRSVRLESPPPWPWRPVIGAATAIAAVALAGNALVSFVRARAPGQSEAGLSAPIHGRLLSRATSEGGRVEWIETGVAALTLKLARGRLFAGGPEGLVVVDLASRRILKVFPDLASPSLAAAGDGARIYARSEDGRVTSIDTSTLEARTLASVVGAMDLRLSADGRDLYIAAGFSGLLRLRVADGALVRLPSVACPLHLALAPDGSRLYVAYQCGGPGGTQGHDAIDVVEAATGSSVATLTRLPNVGNTLFVSPDGAQLWADGGDACSNPAYDHVGCPLVPSRVVHVVRTGDLRVLRSLGFRPGIGGLAGFAPDGSRALFAGRGLNVVDTTTHAVLETLPFGSGPPVFDTRGGRLVLPVRERKALAVVDFDAGACRPAPPGLWSLWAGDGNASDVRDGNHATIEGAAGHAPGLVGQAFRLAAGGAVAARGLATVELDDDFSLGAWIRLEPEGPERHSRGASIALLDYPSGAGRAYFQVWLRADGGVNFCASGSPKRCDGPAGVVTSRTLLRPATWHHLAVGRGGASLFLYLDGEPQGRAAAPLVEDELAQPGVLPRRAGIRFGGDRRAPLRARVDEIELYARALEPWELAHIVARRGEPVCHQHGVDTRARVAVGRPGP